MPAPRPIYLTNTLGRRREEFRPLHPPSVTYYQCGPTVYNFAHIGNFRANITGDTLRRVLEYNGYQVTHVRNITDVGHLTNDEIGSGEDKVELTARAQNKKVEEIVGYYTGVFHQDAERLNLLPPSFEPRATQYVPQMIALTERLIARGHAYVSGGNVYYEVATFPDYGKLSGYHIDELVAGARVEVGEGKRSPADFALWKEAGEDKIMRFDSPWGRGVPGWHLECSAMAIDLLGEEIDIHTGGIDHIFPHHEDEIAQSEGAAGKPFARYWLHNAFLQLAGEEKMSKSLGNIYTVSDLVERGIHPLAFRYFTYQAHYRTPQSFTWEAAEGAHRALESLWEAAAELWQAAEPEELGKVAAGYQERFHLAINNDLNLPAALAVVHEVKDSQLPPGQKLSLLQDFDRVLALDLLATARKLSELSEEEKALLEERAAARSSRDWPRSDRLRAELQNRGLEVRDTPEGQRWVRKSAV